MPARVQWRRSGDGADGDGLVTFEPPVDIPGFTKLAVWHERTHRDPGHRWVRSILFEACGALGSE